MNERKAHWEKVYDKNDMRQVSWFQVDPAPSLAFIDGLSLTHDAPVIDVGGGTSALTAQLIDRGMTNLSVLDISGQALMQARMEMGEKAASVQWIEQDVTEFAAPQRYALWHDRAVFHFLITDQDQQKYRDVLRNAMQPGGYVLMATFAVEGPRRCSGLDTMQYDADLLQQVLGKDFSLLETRIEQHRTPSEAEQKFAWFLFQYQPGEGKS